jgi:predicted HicB family RNase H-like nuclease
MHSAMSYDTPYGVYTGVVEYDPEAEIFHGEVVNTAAVLTFQGRSVAELKKALKDTVDVYIDWCKKRGKEPQKPFSGNIPLRLGGELHGKVAAAALSEGKSVNQFVKDALLEKVADG